MQDESPLLPQESSPLRRSSLQMREWYTDMISKIKLGSLTGVIQLYGEYERERSETLFEEDEQVFNQGSSEGWTLLHEACACGHSHIVQYLVARSVNPNHESDSGLTPLHISVLDENVECVRSLLKHPRIQINKMTQSQPPVLHIASHKGSAVIVQMLIEHKASMVLEDQRALIPLQCATTIEIFELIPRYMGEIELLKSQGKFLKVRAEKMKSEIFTVVNEEMVQVLADLDSDKGKLEFWNGENLVLEFWVYDIWDVKMCNRSHLVFKDWEGFMVVNKSGIHKFYSKDKEEVEKWVQGILVAIEYCHLNKIGFTASPSLSPKENFIPGSILNSRLSNKPISLNSFKIISEIRKCKFGKVFKVCKNDTGHIFAMKQLMKQDLIKSNKLESLFAETALMQNLSHSFIIKLHFSFQTEKNLFLVFDYCSKGTLADRIGTQKKLSEVESKSILSQVILGLQYLHSLDIIYRDLKPKNILIDNNGMIKLFNFALAKENIGKTSSFCGSPAYLPPEMFLKTGYDKSIDVYALGVLLYEMLTGTTPFWSDKIKEIFRNIVRGSLFFPKFLSKNATEIIRIMMNRDPNKRPSLEKIKNHQFFEDLDWEEIEIQKYKKAEEVVERTSSKSSINEEDPILEEADWYLKGFDFSRMSASFVVLN